MGREMVDLLLDWRLPREDGMNIARKLCAESRVPIIMLTGGKHPAAQGSAELIRTERGAGYLFTAPVEVVR